MTQLDKATWWTLAHPLLRVAVSGSVSVRGLVWLGFSPFGEAINRFDELVQLAIYFVELRG
jgi:hypothetical protein